MRSEKKKRTCLIFFGLSMFILINHLSLLAENPSSVSQVVAFFKEGRTQDAIDYAKKLIKENSNNFEAAHALAEIYLASEDFQNARKTYLDLTQKNPKDAPAHNNLGLLYLKREMPKEAIRSFRKAIEIDPNFLEAHFNLGETALVLGQKDRALTFFQEAETLSQKFQSSHQSAIQERLGILYARKEKQELAIEQFKKALKTNPDHVRTRRNLGFAYLASGKVKEAEQEFQKVLQTEPDHAMTHYALGVSLRRLKQDQESLSEFKKAIGLDPELIEAYFYAGDLLTAAGQKTEAFEIYRKVLPLFEKFLKKNSGDSLTRFQYAQVLTQLGETEAAKEQLKKVAKKEKKNSPLAQASKARMEDIQKKGGKKS